MKIKVNYANSYYSPTKNNEERGSRDTRYSAKGAANRDCNAPPTREVNIWLWAADRF